MESCKKGQKILWKVVRKVRKCYGRLKERSRNVMEGCKKVKKCYERL